MNLLKRVLKRVLLTKNHPDEARTPLAELEQLTQQIVSLHRQGRWEQGINVARRACDLTRTQFGEAHPYFTGQLNNLAEFHRLAGHYAAAEPLYKKLIEIDRMTDCEKTADHANALNNLALLYTAMQRYSEAETLYRRALEILRATGGEKNSSLASVLNNLGQMHDAQGQFVAAESLFKEALEICKNALSDNDPILATCLNNLAALYRKIGKYSAAESIYNEVLGKIRITLGENHPSFATALNNLAVLYLSTDRDLEAEALFKRALEIRRAILAPDHPDIADILTNLASLYKTKGNFALAEPIYEKLLDISRRHMQEGEQQLSSSLTGLANLYVAMGKYTDAERIYRQVLDMDRTNYGEIHPKYAVDLNNLGHLFHAMELYTDAETFYRHAIEIWRSTLSKNDPRIATALNNLAGVYFKQGRYTEAKPLFEDALNIRQEVLTGEHREVAQSMNNLGMIHHLTGDQVSAERLIRRALHLRRAGPGRNHPDVAQYLNNLGTVMLATGRVSDGVSFLQDALEIKRKTLGAHHPSLITSLINLAWMYALVGREDYVLSIRKEAALISDMVISQVFSIGSERQRMAHLAILREDLNSFLSLVVRWFPQSSPMTKAGLDLVLTHKALGAEALAAQRDAVLGGHFPELYSQLQELTALRMTIAQHTLAGAESQANNRDLLVQANERKEVLEQELARQIPEMKLEQSLHTANREHVAAALPAGTALVEFVLFDTFDLRASQSPGQSRYAAFIVSAHDPNHVQMVDLGEAGSINTMIAEFRNSVLGTASESRHLLPDVKNITAETVGADLRAALFDPIAAKLNGCSRVFLATDGDIVRLPFEALPLANGERIIDAYDVIYLSTGRDLLRFNKNSVTRSPAAALVLADPDFDLASDETLTQSSDDRILNEKRIRDYAGLTFSRLAGTRDEGEEIARLLNVAPVMHRNVLKSSLRTYRSPRILHIATHGFFLPDRNRGSRVDPLTDNLTGMVSNRLSGENLQNPLLRSGLALAGANTWLRGGSLPAAAENGILTAEDITGLDLLDTDLVVLSACDTGLGEIRVGEGVFGMRRAFALAGARTLVVSLWKVPDDHTKELMIDFYKRLLSGQPCAAALRDAQLALKRKYPHPFFWGAFICQGDPDVSAD